MASGPPEPKDGRAEDDPPALLTGDNVMNPTSTAEEATPLFRLVSAAEETACVPDRHTAGHGSHGKSVSSETKASETHASSHYRTAVGSGSVADRSLSSSFLSARDIHRIDVDRSLRSAGTALPLIEAPAVSLYGLVPQTSLMGVEHVVGDCVSLDKILEVTLSNRREGDTQVVEATVFLESPQVAAEVHQRLNQKGITMVRYHEALPWVSEHRRRVFSMADHASAAPLLTPGSPRDSTGRVTPAAPPVAAAAAVIGTTTTIGATRSTHSPVASWGDLGKCGQRTPEAAGSDNDEKEDGEHQADDQPSYWCHTCEVEVRGPGPLDQLRKTHEAGSRHAKCIRLGSSRQRLARKRAEAELAHQAELQKVREGLIPPSSAEEAVAAFPEDLQIVTKRRTAPTITVIPLRRAFPLANWKAALHQVLQLRNICIAHYMQRSCDRGDFCVMHHDIRSTERQLKQARQALRPRTGPVGVHRPSAGMMSTSETSAIPDALPATAAQQNAFLPIAAQAAVSSVPQMVFAVPQSQVLVAPPVSNVGQQLGVAGSAPQPQLLVAPTWAGVPGQPRGDANLWRQVFVPSSPAAQ
eukprot:TRINITY_DN5490_c0_g1_i2.p1 TRINITY_DN5490_c0_g1~~TRINITY_DN5490_c0_g1_i2.p1  ORF type:complete len:609 (+),score=-12.75 TRINITY_DN5490_c0_g1_i2:80-1828(+)